MEVKERILHGIRHYGGFCLVSRPEGSPVPFDLDFSFCLFAFFLLSVWWSCLLIPTRLLAGE